MPTWLIVLFVASGILALGALGQLVASWREHAGKPSPGGAVALLGARMCLGCWSFGLGLKAADWAVGGVSEPIQPLQVVLGIGFYGAIFVAAAGIVIATIGAAAWLIHS